MKLHAIWVGLMIGCASAEGGHVVEGPGPKKPLAPDTVLDTAEGQEIADEAAMKTWLETRVANAQKGEAETARLPLVRLERGFAIAKALGGTPSYPVLVVDMTSAGIPFGAWEGWVDGRFSGVNETNGLPVFNVLRQSERRPEEPAVVKVRAGR